MIQNSTPVINMSFLPNPAQSAFYYQCWRVENSEVSWSEIRSVRWCLIGSMFHFCMKWHISHPTEQGAVCANFGSIPKLACQNVLLLVENGFQNVPNLVRKHSAGPSSSSGFAVSSGSRCSAGSSARGSTGSNGSDGSTGSMWLQWFCSFQ